MDVDVGQKQNGCKSCLGLCSCLCLSFFCALNPIQSRESVTHFVERRPSLFLNPHPIITDKPNPIALELGVVEQNTERLELTPSPPASRGATTLHSNQHSTATVGWGRKSIRLKKTTKCWDLPKSVCFFRVIMCVNINEFTVSVCECVCVPAYTRPLAAL